MTVIWREIGVEAASDQLERFHVIDVREPEEFDGPLGHVPGSELLPLSRVADSAERLRARPLLVVCRSGNRSGRACAQLAELGVAQPTNLAGGMLAWNEAGLPVERDEAGTPPERTGS